MTDQNGYQAPQNQNNGNEPGKGAAIGSLVLGIIGLVVALIINGVVGLVLGIIGMVLASKAKNEGFTGGMRTGGFVLSLLAIIFGAIGFVACIACAGAIGLAGSL